MRTAFIRIALVVVAAGLCAYVAAVAHTRYSESWQAEQEQIAAAGFHERQDLYRQLLASWTRLVPDRCGSSRSEPGFVSFDSITASPAGTYALARNDIGASGLTIEGIAQRLKVEPQAVRSVVDQLRAVAAPEIAQSGAAVKIISPANDTHGILHVDSACNDSTLYASWSKLPPDNSRHYIRLKNLGEGWYYYVEQR